MAVLTAFWLELRVQAGGKETTTWIDDLGELFAALSAAGASLWRADQSHDRARRSWIFIAAGTASWAVGQAIWSYYELLAGRNTPFPSLADAGFLGFPVLALVGLCLRPAAAFDRNGRVRVMLDSLLVAASLFLLSWVTAFGQVLIAGGSRLTLAVSLAYPVGDLLLLTVSLVVVAHASSSARIGLGLLAAGFAALSIADSGFAYLTAAGTFGSGNQIDAGWAAGFVILAMAALYDRPNDRASRRTPLTKVALLLPYLPAGLGLALAAYRVRGHHADNVSLISAVVIIWALLARQLLVLSDNRRLMAVVSRQAFYDDLTGLANRALFRDRLAHAVQQHGRTLRPLTVVLLDLDDFKAVNDNLGHAAGDELLVRFAERLRDNVRIGDTVARLGGERHLLDDVVLDNLRALRRLGVRLAVDDFGVGYSSFARLEEISPDIVKIDRSFISPLSDASASTLVLHGLIDLIHRAGAVAVGEGVEHRIQLLRLIDLGCDGIQGFLTGRPMPERSAHGLVGAAPVPWQLTAS